MTVVGIDVKNISLHGGGIATLVKAMLPELVARTPTFDWVAVGPAASLAQLPQGVRTSRVEMREAMGRARLPLYDQVQLRRVIHRERLDLFYSPYFDAPAWVPVPVVVTMHDAVYLRFPDLYRWSERAYYEWLMRHHGRRAAAVITDSEFSRSELVALAGIREGRAHVVPCALPPSFVRPAGGCADPSVLARYSLQPGYVLYTGGVEERKNLPRLLGAFRRWRAGGGELSVLVMTGNLSRYAPLMPEVARLGLEHAVRFAGRVADEDLPHVYAAARAVVYPSLYEGFGFPLLEAMTIGVPVACSNRGSLPDIGGDGARYFDPESEDAIVEALDEVVTNAVVRARLIEAGFRRAAGFSIRATAESVARLLTEAARR